MLFQVSVTHLGQIMPQTNISTIKNYLRTCLRFLNLLFTSKSSMKRMQKISTRISRRLLSKSFLRKIPKGSWDSHIHVIDTEKYPLIADARYTPKSYTLSQALTFESSLGLSNIVLVQPSIYGNNNSCMLDALRSLGPARGRAVVAFDPSQISTTTLEEWHKIGVRGVRLNFVSVGKLIDAEEFTSTLRQYAEIIRPYGWVLQLYAPLAASSILEKVVPELGIRICLDHFAAPSLEFSPHKFTSNDPYSLPGFISLVNLLKQGNTYVKLSAPYRISNRQTDLEPIMKELLQVAGGTKVVFATDWPHTRFEGLDIQPFVERVLQCCRNDASLIEKLFKKNAEDLWSVKD